MKQLKNIGIALISIAAMAAGFWLSSVVTTNSEVSRDNNVVQTGVLSVARKIAVPELLKDDGSDFTNADLQGHWTLVFFGYTHCPDICPTTLGMLAQAKKNFAVKFPEIEFPDVMLVSVDPQRDTVEILNEYVKYFDPDFIGITGKPEMIKALTLQMSVVYMQMLSSTEGKETDQANYAIDHSSSILMINPDGKLYAFLNSPHTVTSIVDSVSALMD